MPGWMNYKLEPRLPGKISINSDMQVTPPLWQKVKRRFALGVGDGQGGLMCCDSWGGKESDTTERLN